MIGPILIGTIVGGILCYLFYKAGIEFRSVFHILRNDPLPVRELQQTRGPVEIEGTTKVDDGAGTVTAPFTGTECLAYTYEVEEYQSSGKNSSWQTLDEGINGRRFLVEDETGIVPVVPDGSTIRLEDQSITISPGDEVPGHIKEYMHSTDEVDVQDGTIDLGIAELSTGNKQRFTERRLDVGEPVYVYGHAKRGESTNWGSKQVDATVTDGPAAPVFVISDTDERGTAARFAYRGSYFLGLAILILVTGLFILLDSSI